MTVQKDAFFTEEQLHKVEPPAFLVEGILPMRSVNMCFGEFNIGKTFIVMDMAAHVSIGKPWLGRETQDGDVLYIASEGDPGNLGVRMDAWRKHHDIEFPLPVLYYADIVNLLDDAPVLIQQAVDMGYRPKLVVVDTLSMALVGNENDNSVMNELIKVLRRNQTYVVDGEEHELAWLLVHHTGWEKGRPRGGSSMPGGLDFVFGIEQGPTENTVKMFSFKAKNAAKFLPLWFHQKEIGNSIVYEQMPHAVAKIAEAAGRGSSQSEMQKQLEGWQYYEGHMAGYDFSQSMFRKAFGYTDKDKSGVSAVFKRYLDAGEIELVAGKPATYRKVGIDET